MEARERRSADVEPQTERDSFNLTKFLAKHFEVIMIIELSICFTLIGFIGFIVGKIL